MSEKLYPVPQDWTKRAFVDDAKYKAMYDASIKNPEQFWGEHGKRIDWIKPFTKVKNTTYAPGNVSIKWFEDGTTNVSMNLSASRSRIQDTDYAQATTELAKRQIIQQAATAMLAQANQQPQTVLTLLK